MSDGIYFWSLCDIRVDFHRLAYCSGWAPRFSYKKRHDHEWHSQCLCRESADARHEDDVYRRGSGLLGRVYQIRLSEMGSVSRCLEECLKPNVSPASPQDLDDPMTQRLMERIPNICISNDKAFRIRALHAHAQHNPCELGSGPLAVAIYPRTWAGL